MGRERTALKALSQTELRRPATAIVCLASLVFVAGCGYTTDALHRRDVQTVAVPIFESNEYRRGLEYELTRELVNLIELRTPYKVADEAGADTVLSGRVLDLAETVLTEDVDDNVTAAQVTLLVSYQWKDLRTGQVIREGMPHRAWHFAESEGQTLRSAQTAAIRKLAETIIEDMEEPW